MNQKLSNRDKRFPEQAEIRKTSESLAERALRLLELAFTKLPFMNEKQTKIEALRIYLKLVNGFGNSDPKPIVAGIIVLAYILGCDYDPPKKRIAKAVGVSLASVNSGYDRVKSTVNL